MICDVGFCHAIFFFFPQFDRVKKKIDCITWYARCGKTFILSVYRCDDVRISHSLVFMLCDFIIYRSTWSCFFYNIYFIDWCSLLYLKCTVLFALLWHDILGFTIFGSRHKHCRISRYLSPLQGIFVMTLHSIVVIIAAWAGTVRVNPSLVYYTAMP